MADDYTPTTEQVRTAWHDEMFPNASDAAFDRWLAAHDAAIRANRVTVAPERVQGLADRMRSQASMLRVAPILWVEIQSARMLLEEGAALLASGVLGAPADQVRAETLEAAADDFAPGIVQSPPPKGVVRGVHETREWLRARAAEYRKADQ